MNGSRALVVVWLVLLSACAWQVSRTTIVSDLTHFLPRHVGLAEQILVGQMREGRASRLILIAIEGADPKVLAQSSRALADALRGNPLYAAVHNGVAEFAEADGEFLLEQCYLLSARIGAETFTTAGLRRALQARLEDLSSLTGVIGKPSLARDPLACVPDLLRTWQPADGPERRHGVWFSRDGARALMILETVAPGFDLEAQAAAVQALRQGFETARGAQSLRLVLTGPPVFSVEANRLITRDAARLSALNVTAVLLLLWVVYRTWGVLLLGSLPLVCGALGGAAAVGWWFGSLHAITLGFGATLIGVAADYPNHLFTHRLPQETAHHAIRRIWPTLRLGILTNVAGFTAMLFSGFEGLAQLGLFAAVGLLAAGAAVRWLLPILMPARVSIADGLIRAMARLPSPSPRWGWIPPAVAIGAVVWLWYGPIPLWNDDIGALNPISAASKQLDEDLRREIGAPDLRKLLIIQGDSDEAVLTASEGLAARLDPLVRAGILQGYDMAARYLPSHTRQAERQDVIPSPETLRERLAQAQRGLAFREGAFEPFLADAALARTRPLLSASSPLPDVLASRVRSLLFQQSEGWVGLVPLRVGGDEERLRQALVGLDPDQVVYVDLREESSRLLGQYRREALRLLGWSTLAIVLLLVVGLRSLSRTLRVLLPMGSAAVTAAVLMAVEAGGLSLFHLVSLLLVMGLSLDQALFFSRATTDGEERARTLLSVLLCNVSALIAFGILATSSVNLLHDIGATVAVGAGFALVFTALLNGVRSDRLGAG